MGKKPPIFVYLALLFSMICWGLSFVWYKQAQEFFAPITLVLFRLLISVPLLVTASIVLRRFKKISRKDFPYFLTLAFFEPFAYFMSETFGIQYVSPTVAAILISTVPIFTSIVAYLFYNEKLSLMNYFGVLLSFAGAFAVILSDKNKMEASGLGIALMLTAVFSALVYGFLVKKIASKYNPLTIVTVQNSIAALYFAPIFFLFEYKELNFAQLSIGNFMPVIYLSVFASTFAYIGFIQGLRVLGLAKATVFANFIPVCTAIFAFLILGDNLGWVKLGGVGLVVLGLLFSQGNKNKSKKTKEIIVDELY